MTRISVYFVWAGVVLFACASWSQKSPDQLDLLDQLLVDMQDQTRSELVDRVRSLEIENADLLERNLTLENALESDGASGLEAILGELMSENADLRETIQLLMKRIAAVESGVTVGPKSPTGERGHLGIPPNTDFSESRPDAEYEIMKEWGRSPEVTAGMPGNVASLKGMSVYVRPGMSDVDLETVARYLRSENDMYDNINIEVFDNAEASRDFADSGRASPLHRVLSISKHRKSGRDMMFLFRDGQARELLK